MKPKVDWENLRCNKSSLPKPEDFPIQGASEDPDFYNKKKTTKFMYERGVVRSTYEVFAFSEDEVAPFGSLPGVKTNLGVVSMPAKPVRGYLWSQEDKDWVVHAVTIHCEKKMRGVAIAG